MSNLIRYESIDNALDSMDQSLMTFAQSKHRLMPSLLLRVRMRLAPDCALLFVNQLLSICLKWARHVGNT